MELRIKKFHPEAKLPTKAHITDAGYDLSSIENTVIHPFTHSLVDTGIGICVPIGTYGRIAPRSGISMKDIIVNAGVIDPGYTNSVKVLLYNLSKVPFKIEKGDRIAQLILEKVELLATVIEVSELNITDRGLQGFGSSGTK